MNLKKNAYYYRYRIIYGDTDQMGVVYYGNYMRFFEAARTEMFRETSMSYHDIEKRGYYLPVSEAHCKYIKSATYDDEILVETRVDPEVKSFLKFLYTIYRASDRTLLAEGYTVHPFVEKNGKAVRPPKDIWALLVKESP